MANNPTAGQNIAKVKKADMALKDRRTEALRLWVIEGKPYREIAGMLGVSLGTVHHDINTAIEERQDAMGKALAVDVKKELSEQLRFAKKLRRAAEEALADPEDPLRLAIIPRADEIEVAYDDWADMTGGDNPKPKKKKATLQLLLARVEDLGVEPDKITIKSTDLRKFALDSISVTDGCIDKFAKVMGAYMNPKTNEDDVLALARRVTKNLIEAGKTPAEAAEFCAERYGVLEAELLA